MKEIPCDSSTDMATLIYLYFLFSPPFFAALAAGGESKPTNCLPGFRIRTGGDEFGADWSPRTVFWKENGADESSGGGGETGISDN